MNLGTHRDDILQLLNHMHQKDLALLRKHFDGTRLTQSERRRLRKLGRDGLREWLIEIAISAVAVLPVVGYIVRTCFWPG